MARKDILEVYVFHPRTPMAFPVSHIGRMASHFLVPFFSIVSKKYAGFKS